MFLGTNVGGESYINLKTIFSGNGSAYYPHEVVHLYTNQNFKNIHDLLDEGIAAYFGGTQGLDFKECMEVLYSFLNKNDIDVYKTVFVQDQWINMTDKVSLYYSFGALLCHIILKEYDKDTLFEVMNNCKDNESLLLKIETLFKIKREEINQLITKELDSFLQQ